MKSIFAELPNDLIIQIVQIENDRKIEELLTKRKYNEVIQELNKLSGQALHAKTLEFVHPKTKKWMRFNSELPKEFEKILTFLENLSG